ncbi:MAG: folate family ECF transporter S component, partial [Anaeroplasmataceae bacterium]|nr:folate family ECF transporter S component [Anaeroplasmataceae bacterium]
IEVEDNQVVYKSIFHKSYWKDSIGFINNVKKMCTISILFACMILCKFLPIPSGFGSLGISFTYLFFGIICWIYGPLCGIFIGFCSDILGYFINPGGIFFMGYTLDAMLAGFMYGICFYKKRITFANCFIARAFVNLFINVGLGSLWWKMIYNLDWDAYLTYMSLTSLPKNILYLLPQSILLFILFKAISKPLASFGLIDQRVSENISLF